MGKGAAYLYIENISVMLSAYVFWMVISRLTSPEIIGISAAIVSFAAIVTTVQNLGVPISVQRFLGKAMWTKKTDNVRVYIIASLLVLSVSIAVCTIAIFIVKISIPETIKAIDFDLPLVIIALILMASSSTTLLLRGIIIASINTKILAVAAIYSTTAKFLVATILLYIGMGAIGLTIGIASFTVLESILLGIGIKKTFGGALDGESNISLRTSIQILLKGGIPNWVPNLITAVGSQLGTILVFASNGASQAGFYYLAFSIYTGIAAGMSVIFSITYPVLSSLEEGRQSLSRRTIKMSLLSSVPLSYSMIFFTDNIMNIFGHLYVNASSALQILLLSIMPVTLVTGITNLVYAMGNYRYTLLIGMASSIPRALLYFVFVPVLGSVGAALSFTIGSFVGLILSIFIARKVNMPIDWKDISIICTVPLGTSYLLNVFGVNYIASIIITLALSYIIYLKTHIMTCLDIHDAFRTFPKSIAKPILRVIDFFGRKLDSSY